MARSWAPGVFLIWLTGSLSSQQPTSFTGEVNLVNISALVRSSEGNLIPNLAATDFEVLEDGVPQKIQFFARESQSPLLLGLVVDVSGSQEKFLKQHDRDVEKFLQAVLKPADQAFAVCFGNHLRIANDVTSDPQQILEGLQQFDKRMTHLPEIGPKEVRDLGTALYDAIYFSAEQKMAASGERRRVMVVFSDGEENSSEHDLIDAIQASQDRDILVYCIRYTDVRHGKLSARDKYGIRALKHIATLTGGTDFDALASNLGDVFSRISEELHSIYQMGYVSTNSVTHDGAFRKIVIRCKQPGAIVRSKAGYFAR
jgi:Ca-activated chloride channel family protein